MKNKSTLHLNVFKKDAQKEFDYAFKKWRINFTNMLETSIFKRFCELDPRLLEMVKNQKDALESLRKFADDHFIKDVEDDQQPLATFFSNEVKYG